MRFALELVEDPDIEPISLEEMKLHLHEFSAITARDGEITGLIKGAREWVEGFTGRALIDQTWRLTLGNYQNPLVAWNGYRVAGPVGYVGNTLPAADNSILLQRSPILSVISFDSVDASGNLVAIDPLTYQILEADGKWPRLGPLSGAPWMPTGSYQIVFRAGYAERTGSPQAEPEVSRALIPVRYKQAMKLWAEAMYDRDKDMMPLLLETAERLVKPESTQLQIA